MAGFASYDDLARDLLPLRETHLDLAEIAADFTDLDGIRSDPSQT